MKKEKYVYKKLVEEKNALMEENKSLKKELSSIKESETWKVGLMLSTAIKKPLQIPFIIKRIIVAILRRILPSFLKAPLKKFVFAHPYLFHPGNIMHYKRYKAELDNILEEEKYKGIIIYPPTIDWHMPLFQRPQQLALAFADLGYLFFYCTANLNEDNVHGFEKIQNNLYVTNQVELLRKIEGNTSLFISWPINKAYVDKFPKDKLIYDYIDELDVFDTRGKTQQEMQKNFETLMKQADVVVCTADKLFEDAKKYNPKNLIMAPNGVEIEHFKISKKKAVPTDLAEIVKSGKKIIGYYGAIAQWFDYDLLEKLAALRPSYEFVMIGPLDYDKTLEKNNHLFEIDNIHFLGPKSYWELSTYLSYFNVATIPFLVNKITESTSPVKLFEYMAGKKPIVTTAMHECKKYQSVLIGNNPSDFAKKIDEAIKLEKDSKYQALLTKEAAENTWEERARTIQEALDGKR
jgi:glycosyltransferase involved in cell wall biosynthesis